MKYCGHCEQEWAESFQYCPNDATPLEATPPDPLLGQRLGNKYEIVQRIGRGPNGTVYRAHHRIADQPCAVKLLHARLTQPEGQLQPLRRMVRVGLELRSPHTVRLYDFDYAEGIGYFLVEELVAGGSLHTLLQQRGRLPAPVCAALVRHISKSLAEAHACGLAHGHLTPANVLLTGQLPELTAKVSDYGLASLTRTSEAVAGPTADTDLVRLGGLLFRLLTGEEAFQSGAASGLEVRPAAVLQAALQQAEAPAPLAQLALGLLGLEPSQRYRSAAEVASAVREGPPAGLLGPEVAPAAPAAVEPEETRAPTAPPSGWSPTSSPTADYEPLPPPEEGRLSWLRLGIFLGLVLLVGGIVFSLWRGTPVPPSQTAAAPAATEATSVSLPTFDYAITERANEGDPVRHPHVLVRVGGLPLYVIRAKSAYPSPVARAQAIRDALERAGANLRDNPGLRFTLVRRGGNPTIVQKGSGGAETLPIVAITRADVYAYNLRSHEKITPGELAQWWLARTRDYLGLFVSGRAPRLTTRTEDGAALARLYEMARSRNANASQPVAPALQQALSELDPKLRNALETGVFEFPETHGE